MKIAVLLVVALWATVSSSSAAATGASAQGLPQDSELSRAAAAQLQRLASFPRSGFEEQSQPIAASSSSAKKKAARRPAADPRQTRRAPGAGEQELRIPIDFVELFRIFSDSQDAVAAARDKRNGPVQLTPDRMAKLDKYADKLMQDERVQSYMQERIKRDGYGGGYGGGHAAGGSSDSGSFVSGLAGQLVGSVVGLSTTASRGSSSSSGGGHQPAPVYGPPSYQSYGAKESFNIWDFKKAILNTLIQAVKAIGGGVLALKGQLIKGSGFLVSTKGRIISSAGEAISGLGKNLAASALVQPPPPKPYGHAGYAYEAPIITHDAHYDGPPPNADAYHSFGAASDDEDISAGLLIAKPTPSLEVHHDHYEAQHYQPDHHETPHYQADHHETPHYQSDHHETPQYQNNHHETPHYQADHHVEQDHAEHTQHSEEIEDLQPPRPTQDIKDVVGHLTGTLNIYEASKPQEGHEDPPSVPGNALQLQDYNQDNYEVYPPLGNGPPDDHKTQHYQQPSMHESPGGDYNGNPNYGQKYEYPPAASYANAYNPPAKYPAPDFQQHNYLPPPKPHYHMQHAPDIQIEISDHDITGFETGSYGKYKRHPPGLHVVAMQGPLKIPILGPSGYYKSPGFPPSHVNAIGGIGKYPRFGPGFEVQQSIGYELMRRDGKKVHRL